MKHRYNPPYRSFSQPLGGQGQGAFPGIGDPFMIGGGMPGISPIPGESSLQSNVPAIVLQSPENATSVVPATEGGSAKEGFSIGKLGSSINDLKGMVDRLGGIDGILSTMQKVQKVVASVQQMAPLIKVLASSFGKKGGAAAAIADDNSSPAPSSRRRKRRPAAGGGSGAQQRRRARKRKR